MVNTFQEGKLRLSLIQFVRMKFQIAKENPLFWANLALLALSVGFIWLWPSPITEAGPSDFRLRFWAAFLQLTGAGIVFWDLTTSARNLKRTGILANTFKWLKRLVKGHEVVSGTVRASLSLGYGNAGITIRHPPPPPGASLADRVDALEKNTQLIDDDLAKAFKEINDTESKLEAQVKEESSKRETAHKQLESDIAEAIVGNYASLSFGAFWAIIGMLLSAFSQDIAKLVAGQGIVVWTYL